MSSLMKSQRLAAVLSHRHEIGNWALSREEAISLGRRILAMSRADYVQIRLEHRAQTFTRMARSRVDTSSTGAKTVISVSTWFGSRAGRVETDRTDEEGLRSAVEKAEAQARVSRNDKDYEANFSVAKQFVPSVGLFHEETIGGMPAEARGEALATMMRQMKGGDIKAAGFVGVVSSSNLFMNSLGLENFSRWTDSEVTLSARTTDGTGTGWAGQANRTWTNIDAARIAQRAVEIAKRSANPVAVEPGRRTVILSSTAMGQFLAMMMAPTREYNAMSAFLATIGATPFSKEPSGSKLGLQVLDRRVSWISDPNDPLGGYLPYDVFGIPMQTTEWIKDGFCRNLSYTPKDALMGGKAIVSNPVSVRMTGGPSTMEDMIANVKEGFWVNRLASLEVIHPKSMTMTGTTRDGCFLIKNGKIDRAVKNFRFAESPMVFLNQLETLGPTERVALGHMPQIRNPTQLAHPWPPPPIIAPPVLVNDFNFSALTDAI